MSIVEFDCRTYMVGQSSPRVYSLGLKIFPRIFQVLPQLIKSPYKFLRVFRSGNIFEDFFPEVAEFFFGDGVACGE